MNIIADFSKEFDGVKVTVSNKEIPLLMNGKKIGIAKLNDDLSCKMTVNDETINEVNSKLHVGIGGIITSRDGNIINGFNLRECSIVFVEK